MSEIVHISDHADQAEARLPEQYKGMPKLTALVRLAGDRAQTLEDVLYDFLSHSGIEMGHDYLLDWIGEVVGQKRNGATDDVYKAYLFAKIAENVSDGTAETLIALYKALMRAERVYFNPLFPAGFSLTAIGSAPIGSTPEVAFSFFGDPDPLGEGFGDYDNTATGGDFASASGFSAEAIAIIKASLGRAKIAGVKIHYFATVEPVSFSFDGDPDLAGAGFGDYNDSSVGGSLAEII